MDDTQAVTFTADELDNLFGIIREFQVFADNNLDELEGAYYEENEEWVGDRTKELEELLDSSCAIRERLREYLRLKD